MCDAMGSRRRKRTMRLADTAKRRNGRTLRKNCGKRIREEVERSLRGGKKH